MIYFDNAATSHPKPPEVFDSMVKFMQELGGNPGRSGHRMATGAEAMIAECRNAVSKFFGLLDPARCIFTLNCTDALNMAIKGVVKRGDHVVTTALEHNSISRPLQQMAEDGFITLTRVVPEAAKRARGRWRKSSAPLRPKTRLVALTHCANVTGVINPIEALAKALRAAHPKALLLVDAAQSAGVVPINMDASGIDMLAFPGHKALYRRRPGTGALLIGHARVDTAKLYTAGAKAAPAATAPAPSSRTNSRTAWKAARRTRWASPACWRGFAFSIRQGPGKGARTRTHQDRQSA